MNEMILPGAGYPDLIKQKLLIPSNPSMTTIDGVISYQNPQPTIEIDQDYFVAVEKGSFMPYFVLFPKGKRLQHKQKIIIGANSKLVPKGIYVVGLPTIKNVLEHYTNPEYYHIYMGDRYSPFGETVGYYGAAGQGPEQFDFFEYPFQFSVSRFPHRNETAKISVKFKKSFEDLFRPYASAYVFICTAYFYFERLLNYYEQNRGMFMTLPANPCFAGGDTTGVQFGYIYLEWVDRYLCTGAHYFSLAGDALGAKTDLTCNGCIVQYHLCLDYILMLRLFLRNGEETVGAVVNPSYISNSLLLDFNARVTP